MAPATFFTETRRLSSSCMEMRLVFQWTLLADQKSGLRKLMFESDKGCHWRELEPGMLTVGLDLRSWNGGDVITEMLRECNCKVSFQCPHEYYVHAFIIFTITEYIFLNARLLG